MGQHCLLASRHASCRSGSAGGCSGCSRLLSPGHARYRTCSCGGSTCRWCTFRCCHGEAWSRGSCCSTCLSSLFDSTQTCDSSCRTCCSTRSSCLLCIGHNCTRTRNFSSCSGSTYLPLRTHACHCACHRSCSARRYSLISCCPTVVGACSCSCSPSSDCLFRRSFSSRCRKENSCHSTSSSGGSSCRLASRHSSFAPAVLAAAAAAS